MAMSTNPAAQELCIVRHQGPLPDPSPQADRQRQYYEAHKQELMERFPGKWIRIDNEDVVESAPTEHQLFERLAATGPRPHSLVVCAEPNDGMTFIGAVH